MKHVTIAFILALNVFTIIAQKTIKLSSSELAFIESHKDSIPIDNPYGIIGIGYLDIYMGNNLRGNRIMEFGLEKINNPDYELLHELSVQNTKNGNYSIGYDYLTKAAKLNPEVYGYFGWVMLYYYRDYDRTLEYLDLYDTLTPNFCDFPAGESIHYLKGLAYLMKNEFSKSINELDKYIIETSETNGEEWVETSTFYYKGISYEFLGEYQKAITCYNLALKYNANFPEVYYHKALCHKNLKNNDLTIDHLQKCKSLIEEGYSRQDIYVELFYPVYKQNVVMEINLLE